MTKLEEAMEIFNRRFQPATSFDDSDEQFTTTEILEKFKEIVGEESVTNQIIIENFKKAGYFYDYVLDEFRWLLKIKKS
jgi:hypothetical protein